MNRQHTLTQTQTRAMRFDDTQSQVITFAENNRTKHIALYGLLLFLYLFYYFIYLTGPPASQSARHPAGELCNH